jgi:hypothetical protein
MRSRGAVAMAALLLSAGAAGAAMKQAPSQGYSALHRIEMASAFPPALAFRATFAGSYRDPLGVVTTSDQEYAFCSGMRCSDSHYYGCLKFRSTQTAKTDRLHSCGSPTERARIITTATTRRLTIRGAAFGSALVRLNSRDSATTPRPHRSGYQPSPKRQPGR